MQVHVLAIIDRGCTDALFHQPSLDVFDKLRNGLTVDGPIQAHLIRVTVLLLSENAGSVVTAN